MPRMTVNNQIALAQLNTSLRLAGRKEVKNVGTRKARSLLSKLEAELDRADRNLRRRLK